MAATSCSASRNQSRADIDAAPCPARSVATGKDHTCSVDHLGRVFCWGLNADHQVQPGNVDYVLTPTRVVVPSAAQVTSGRDFSCARLDDGDVWCWGNNFFGQLGRGATTTDNGPFRIDGIPPSAEVRAGGMTACSRSVATGEIWCWGSNRDRNAGQAVDMPCAGNESCVLPSLVPGTEGAKALAMGHRHACIIDATDHMACWGKNAFSQLGDGGGMPQRTVPAGIPQIGTVSAIAGSGRSTCAADSAGAKIATGGAHTCVLTSTTGVSCWGDNTHGQLGDGGTTTRYMPATVNGLGTVVDIKAGASYTCTLDDAGAVFCWGYNADGQLGDGTHTGRMTPTKVKLPVGRTAASLSAGTNTACAKLDNAAVYCWGANAASGLGTGTMGSIAMPTSSPGFANAVELATGLQGTCALDAAGQISCAGAKALLANDDKSSSIPTLIAHSACAE